MMHSNSKDNDDQEEEALLKALLLLHRKKTQSTAPQGGNKKFSRVVDHFEHRARRLEREKRATQQLLGYLTPGGDSPPVAKPGILEIVGKRGSHAAGHVRLANESDAPVTMFWVIGAPLSSAAAPPLRFTPNPIELASGQSGLVEISVDLSDWHEKGSITLPLECRSVARLERLQLVIRLEDPT
jgi:hypothetical protein